MKTFIGAFGDIDLELYRAYGGGVHLASDALNFDTAISADQLLALTVAAQLLEDNS